MNLNNTNNMKRSVFPRKFKKQMIKEMGIGLYEYYKNLYRIYKSVDKCQKLLIKGIKQQISPA